MYNQFKKLSPITFTIILIQVIFIIAIIATIVHEVNKPPVAEVRNSQPSLTISGLPSSNVDIPSSYIEDLSHSLTDTVLLNTPNLSLPNSTAIVRDGSITVKNFDQQQFNALSFIVDLPDLEQSYQLYYKYPVDIDATTTPYFNNPRAILCLDDSADQIYPNFDCRTTYPDDTRPRIVADYFNFLTFNNFTATIDQQNPLQINITPMSDVSDPILDSYLAKVKSTISSLGVSPTLFTYRIQN